MENGPRLFPVVFSARMRGNGHKLENTKFHLNTRKHFTVKLKKHWHRLCRTVESFSMMIFKSCLDIVLGKQL